MNNVVVDVTNVVDVSPIDLATWISSDILNVILPEFGPNITLAVNDVIELLPVISNKIAMTTEFYNHCVGAKSMLAGAKKHDKTPVEPSLTYMTSKVDMLYRTVQSLESLRETASRMLTGMNSMNNWRSM